ncbi:MAG: hypothetical protein NTW86_30415, partial [Candidatus Sumerlaeota bacterium]|nr:hypothetical protein [Candidatus Sumerlaeota bacterium]
MKKARAIPWCCAVVLAWAGWTATAFSESKEEGNEGSTEQKTQLVKLPHAVQQTIKLLAGEAKIVEIKTVYEVEIEKNGKTVEFKVAANGKFLGTEKEEAEEAEREKGEGGEKAERGEKGQKGEKEEAEEQGEKGEGGEKAESGEKGQKGEKEEAEEQGEKGEGGEKAERGEKGEKA